MTDDELRDWMQEQNEYNESFRGTKIKPDKLQRLNSMKYMLKQLHEADDRIETPFVPFDNQCRNATVKITIPYVYFSTNRRVQTTMAALFSAADDVAFTSLGGESIGITFGIHDMWEEYHHEGYEGEGKLVDHPNKKK